jgi:hypothetical protein
MQQREQEARAAEKRAECGECTCDNMCMSTSEPPPPPVPDAPAPSDGGEPAPAGTEEQGNPLNESRTRTPACQNFENLFESITGKTIPELNPLRPRDPRAENPDIERLENAALCELGPRLASPSQCSLVVCGTAGIASDIQANCCGAPRPVSLNPSIQQCMRERRCQEDDTNCCADMVLPNDPEMQGPRPSPNPFGRRP